MLYAPNLSRSQRWGVTALLWLLVVGTLGVLIHIALPTGTTVSPNAVTAMSSQVSSNYIAAGDSVSPAGSPGTATDWLPAYRWGLELSVMTVPDGLLDIGSRAVAFLSTLGLLIAGIIWLVLLTGLKFAMSLDFLQSAGNTVNAGAADFYQRISFLFIPIALLGLLQGLRHIARGNGASAFKTFQRYIVILGIATVVGNGAVVANAQGNPNAPGSPTQLASMGNRIADLTSNSVFGPVNSFAQAPSNTAATGVLAPDCGTYMQTLRNTYVQRAGADGDGVMPTLSALWEATMLPAWTTAQFGPGVDGYNPGARSGCFLLEMRATGSKMNASDYRETFHAAFPDIPQASVDSGIWGGVVTHDGETTETRKIVTAWAACSWVNGSWVATPGFRLLGGHSMSDQNSHCKKTLEADSADARYKNDDYFNIKGDKLEGQISAIQGISDKGSYTADTKLDIETQTRAVKSFGDSFNSGSGGAAILQAGIATVTSVIYARVLGPLGFGQLLLQFVLVILLVLLPFSIVLTVAEPRGPAKGTGQKLLRLTGAALLSKLIFTFVISFIVAVVSLGMGMGRTAMGASGTQLAAGADSYQVAAGGAGSGLANQMVIAVMPLLALFAVKWLFKKIGLGDISNLSGAMGFMGAAANAAAGERSGGGLLGGMSKAMGNIPLPGKVSELDRKGKAKLGKDGKPMTRQKRVGDVDGSLMSIKDPLRAAVGAAKGAAGVASFWGGAAALPAIGATARAIKRASPEVYNKMIEGAATVKDFSAKAVKAVGTTKAAVASTARALVEHPVGRALLGSDAQGALTRLAIGVATLGTGGLGALAVVGATGAVAAGLTGGKDVIQYRRAQKALDSARSVEPEIEFNGGKPRLKLSIPEIPITSFDAPMVAREHARAILTSTVIPVSETGLDVTNDKDVAKFKISQAKKLDVSPDRILVDDSGIALVQAFPRNPRGEVDISTAANGREIANPANWFDVERRPGESGLEHELRRQAALNLTPLSGMDIFSLVSSSSFNPLSSGQDARALMQAALQPGSLPEVENYIDQVRDLMGSFKVEDNHHVIEKSMEAMKSLLGDSAFDPSRNHASALFFRSQDMEYRQSVVREVTDTSNPNSVVNLVDNVVDTLGRRGNSADVNLEPVRGILEELRADLNDFCQVLVRTQTEMSLKASAPGIDLAALARAQDKKVSDLRTEIEEGLERAKGYSTSGDKQAEGDELDRVAEAFTRLTGAFEDIAERVDAETQSAKSRHEQLVSELQKRERNKSALPSAADLRDDNRLSIGD